MSSIVKPERVGGIHKIKIDDILIHDRVRTIMGDMENLALSMEVKGLIEPIIVDIGKGGKYNLIEGERRVRAAEINGWRDIDAIMLESLSEADRLELEIITCIHKEKLQYVEEARAVKKLVDKRKLEAQKGNLAQVSYSIKNKDIAIELNMTESRMSENLRIAEAIEDHPEIEAEALTRSRFLNKIRKQDFFVPKGGMLQKIYEENFVVASPLETLDSIQDKIINLCILHPDVVDIELLDKAIERLAVHGQIIVFTQHKHIREWEDILQERGLTIGHQPYIWAVKGGSDYQNYIWAGLGRPMPLRAIPSIQSAARPSVCMNAKAKPFALMNYVIKCTTERGGFVVIPDCYDIDTVRCCVEIGRNVRAGQVNKILRDKLIMSVVKNERK